jgi:hypothetical protein
MYFIVGLFLISFLLNSMNLCVFLTDAPSGSAPILIGGQAYSRERLTTALLIGLFGATWLIGWTYLFSIGVISAHWTTSFIERSVVELISVVAMFVSAVALFYNWPKAKLLFLLAMVLIAGSMAPTMIHFKALEGESIALFLAGVWIFLAGSFLAIPVYFLDNVFENLAPEVRNPDTQET